MLTLHSVAIVLACTEISQQSFSEAVCDVTTKEAARNKMRRQAVGNTCGGELVGMVRNSQWKHMHCEYGWGYNNIEGS